MFAKHKRISRIFLPGLVFLFTLFSFSSFGATWFYWCLRYRDNGSLYAVRAIEAGRIPGYIWVRENYPVGGNNPYNILGTDPPVWLYSSSVGGQFESDNVEPLNNFLGGVGEEDPQNLNLLDYTVPPSNGLPPYRPVGTVMVDLNGNPYAISGYDASGERAVIPVTPVGDGYYSGVGYNDSGQQGTYYVNPPIDGSYGYATFEPSPSDSVVDTDKPPSVTDNITPPVLDVDGNVSLPTTSVTVPDGSGGTSTIVMRDYTPLLSQIAINQIEGINRRDSSFQQLNENLQSLFVADSASLEENAFDSPDLSDVQSESELVLSDVSGWDFSFGLGSNPIGNVITSLFGNPPTNFGSVDEVWDVQIPIYGDLTVNSSFKLSDYFIPAFRSALLMILTVVFAIAVAKQVSGAFS